MVICPKCESEMSERIYVKESENFKKGFKKDKKGRETKKYYKEYVYECLKCGHKVTRDDYVDLDPKSKPSVFIGHGRNEQWRDLKDHLHEMHGYNVEAYETGARAGHEIRDILEEMMEKVSFAVLVMTGEDEGEGGKKRARQNVVHELGLFQGRLGFTKAIVLLEDGTEDFSNLNGVQQIRYNKGNIRETFGEVVASLNREFPPY